jgi:transposase
LSNTTGPVVVFAGADTHADTIHIAVVTEHGQDLADQELPTTAAGYARAISFITTHGVVQAFGIEGTSSYGAGLARAARTAGLDVIEVNQPDRHERRRKGKSDPLDAYAAARAVAFQRATTPPKDEQIEGIRALLNVRRSAVKAATAAINQIRQMLITAPEPVRARYPQTEPVTLTQALARSRSNHPDPVTAAVLVSLRALARRYRALQAEICEITDQLDQLVTTANPALRAAHGTGPVTTAQLLITAGANPDRLRTEASFAALCGTAPVPASSGKATGRYRLSRGGDRQANNALHRIALVRMTSHQPTKDYVARQRARGRTPREILRQLKRAIAREVFRYLTQHIPVPQIADLRPLRQARNITLTSAANHFGIWPAVISTLERGTRRDDALATAYRDWLLTA